MCALPISAEGVPERTVLHCFTGGPEEARRCLDLGAMLSFSGIVTFPSATDLHDAARLCPIDSLLVETDSPYLAPVPHRGKRNQPAWVTAVGARVAELQARAVDDIAEATWAHAERDRKSTRLNSSHYCASRMPSSART